MAKFFYNCSSVSVSFYPIFSLFSSPSIESDGLYETFCTFSCSLSFTFHFFPKHSLAQLIPFLTSAFQGSDMCIVSFSCFYFSFLCISLLDYFFHCILFPITSLEVTHSVFIFNDNSKNYNAYLIIKYKLDYFYAI